MKPADRLPGDDEQLHDALNRRNAAD